MKFDAILSHVGSFGTYQRRLYFLMSLIALPSALHTFSMVFLSAKTDYWCAVPELSNFNCTTSSSTFHLDADCLDFQKNISIPREVDQESGEVRYSQCKRFNLTGLDLSDTAIFRSQPPLVVGGDVEDGDDGVKVVGAEGVAYNLSSEEEGVPIIQCDAGYVYDTSQYTSTINHQFELVCDQASDAKYAHSAYFAGMLIGALLTGLLADWIGRKPTFLICLVMSFLTGIAQAYAPNLIMFIFVRFLLALFKLGLYMMAFIIGTELVGPSKRAFVGQFINIYFAIGYMLLAPFAYLIRDWQMLQLALTLAYIPFFLIIPFIPESARWLMSRGRYADAEKIIRKMAKVNKVELPDEVFDDKDKEEDKQQEQQQEQQQQQVSTKHRHTPLDLFRAPNIRCKTINILFCWFVNNMVYYGISLSTSELGVDHYIAAFVAGAVEIPAYISTILSMQFIGRRLPLCSYLVLSGISCIVASLFAPGTGRAVVAMIGKFCISASFGVVYTYSAELYPTPVRSMGMGLSSMMARVSGILCPFILDLGTVWSSLPYIIFGAFAIGSGLLILLLPETLGKPLPETLMDAEMTGGQCRQGQGTRPDTSQDVGMEERPYKSLPVDEPKIHAGHQDNATEKV